MSKNFCDDHLLDETRLKQIGYTHRSCKLRGLSYQSDDVTVISSGQIYISNAV